MIDSIASYLKQGLLLLLLCWFLSSNAQAENCENLRNAEIDGAFVTSAVTVEASETLPAHCRVRARALPQISIEVLLPESMFWNGKYLQAGCGAGCGVLARADRNDGYVNAMKPALKLGYATATSDSGHHSLNIFDLSWAQESRSAMRDWAWRSIGETERVANALIDHYYANPASNKYFKGCSTGGRLALTAAARYPELFDGVISGAPVIDSVSQAGYMSAWLYDKNTDENGNTILQPSKVSLVADVVMDQCDAIDGTVDNIIADPSRCDVDFSASACAENTASDHCLTQPEIQVLGHWYSGPTNSQGQPLHVGGIPKGSEKYWWLWLTGNPEGGPGQLLSFFGDGFLRYMAFDDNAQYTHFSAFDFDTPRSAFSSFAQNLTIEPSDMQAFKDAGGKLIIWHGLADAMISPYPTIEWFEELTENHSGPDTTNDFAQLFLIPGLDHCGVLPSVNGLDQHDLDPIHALDEWVENGTMPTTVLVQ